MKNVLAIDVAKNKSMVCLISEDGVVYIEPFEFNHNLNEFNLLELKINFFNLNNITVFMESTSTYHLPVERFFKERNFQTHIINPIHAKNNKSSLRKTKTDKEDCLSLATLFFKENIKNYNDDKEDLYSKLRELSREVFSLDEGLTRLKNRYIQTLNLTVPEASNYFKGQALYGKTALGLFYEFPHSEIIKNKRSDAFAYNMAKTQNRHLNYYKKKADIIKEASINSYPGVSVSSNEIYNLKQLITLLKAHAKEIDKTKEKMISLAKESPLFLIILSIPGIGELSASLLLAELKDVTRFNNVKQINAYCGLDPSIIQSGKSVNYHGPISKRGNKYARKVLFNCSSNIITTSARNNTDNSIYVYFRKKQSENKHHYESIIACSTKLIRIIYTMCKNNSSFID